MHGLKSMEASVLPFTEEAGDYRIVGGGDHLQGMRAML